nr:translocase of chloroplast 34, chloroplastic [Tanacetum cinerariifolium]
MEEINNFQQEPDETLYQAWERFKELLMKCPQHYLTEMQEPSKKWPNILKKWHNRTSWTRSTKTSDGLAAIQAQLNNLGREIKKVNEKVYATQSVETASRLLSDGVRIFKVTTSWICAYMVFVAFSGAL